MKVFVLYLIYLLTFCKADYWEEREKLIKWEESQTIGANITLNGLEEEVNTILMKMKLDELDNGFKDPKTFLPSRHFFYAKCHVKKSKLFNFIKKLPKGCSLHGHDASLTSSDYLYNVTYYNNLYACFLDGKLQLHFFKTSVQNNDCKWKLVSEWRSENILFDALIKSQMTLIVPHPETAYIDIDAVWKKFGAIFGFIQPLIGYKPVLQEQVYQYLLELYEDNVMYGEFRGVLTDTYDLDGKMYNPEEIVELYLETLNLFMEHYKDFQGARFIYAPPRDIDNKTLADHIDTARALKKKYPNFIAGFDLVGQEDIGKPLIDFVDQLQNLSKEMNVFYHAGETNWYGESTDLNIIDAILLGAKRIGHGYSITKHPEALRLIKERNIAIEVNPISNQVLKLVDDIRNHPATILIGEGYPVIISNDDPALWGAQGLSYDWYMAFLGMTSRNVGLKFLKQLALNSYLYNAMSDEERTIAIKRWNDDWNKFILNAYNDANAIYNVIVT